jgi:O-antigen/teichoic acid export membrane protein
MGMHTKLRQLLRKQTSRDVVVNILGTYSSVVFALVFVLVLTRLMGEEEYGVLSVLLGIIYVLANIMEFGTTATIFSSVPSMYLHPNRHGLNRFIKSTFYYQTIFSAVVIGLLILSFPQLDALFFKTGASYLTLTVSAISVLGFIWQNTLLNIMFAVKKFLEANLWLFISNFLKTLILFVLLPLNLVSVESVIIVFGLIGPLIFLVAVAARHYKMALNIILHTKPNRDDFKVRYTLTNFAAQQFLNTGMRMDLFILSYFGMRKEVGEYGLAQKIILTIISTVISVTQVLSPAYSSIKTRTEVRRELKHSLTYLLFPTSLFAGVVFVPDVVFGLLFANKFEGTANLTRIMAMPFVVFSLAQVLGLLLLYTFKKPKDLLVSYVFFFIAMTVGCLSLIPRMGVLGAPVTILLSFVVMTAIQMAYVKQHYCALPSENQIPVRTQRS